MKKIIFLDRDGTINIEKNYLHKWEDFEFEENVIDGLKELQNLGYEFIIVTNQSGIARGYYSEEDLNKLNDAMKSELKKYGINILDIYYCPHHLENGVGKYKIDCECRKPNPGMLLKGINLYDVDVKNSLMVGDKKSDIEAGERIGIKSVLVLTGYGKETRKNINKNTMIVKNLLELSNILKI